MTSASSNLLTSWSQRGFYFTHSFFSDHQVLNIAVSVRLVGSLNEGALQRSLDTLVQRHELLRTTLRMSPSGLTATLHDVTTQPLERIDISDVPPGDRDAQLVSIRQQRARARLDLSQLPHLRTTLVRCAENEHVLLIIVHHVVHDGAALYDVYFKELTALYNAEYSGGEAGLEPAPSWSEFVAWEAEQYTGPKYEKKLEFWRQSLAGAPPSVELPMARPRPPIPTGRVARVEPRVFPGYMERLSELSSKLKVWPSTVLLAALYVLLYRYSNQRDLVVGVPAANRMQRRFKAIFGPLLNTLPMRAELDPAEKFVDLAKRIQGRSLKAFLSGDLAFEKIVEQVGQSSDPSRNPLHQVLFNFLPFRVGSLPLTGLDTTVTFHSADGTALDITLDVSTPPEGLTIGVEYAADLYTESTMGDFMQHYVRILDSVLAEPETQLSQVQLLSESESFKIVHEWNRTELDHDRSLSLHALVEAQVARNGERIAVVAGESSLSYAELDRRANRVATRLRTLGVERESFVGLCLSRSENLLIGLLGILKSGAAYVPLDPAYPAERLEFTLQDCEARVLVTETAQRERLPAGERVCLNLDEFDPASDAHPILEMPAVPASDLAYVIYTSGSTGRPKGVAIEHRNAVALVHWAQTVFSPEELAGVLASTSVCFDLSVFELFVTWASGGTVILAENALSLPTLGAKSRVTLINTVPSAITELLDRSGVPESVRVVNLAGEPLKQALSDRIYALGTVQKVYDLYGPSEDTTYSTWMLREAGGPETIGRPIANTQLYILSPEMAVQPVGVPGEILLGGEGLARGYLNRPEVTAASFITNPISGTPSERLYRTGDLARFRADGNVEYVGRIGNQVKVRGFRIELGEIDAVLRENSDVVEALTMVREDVPGDKRIVAYLVLSEASTTSPTALREAAAKRLPSYMLPQHFVFLEQLPLTPNGKVDRKALPQPQQHAKTAYREPEELDRIDDPAQWFWGWDWQAAPAIRRDVESGERWLIFADSLGIAERVAEAIRRRGGRATLVHSSDSYLRSSTDSYSLNPELGAEQYECLCDDLRADDNFPTGVLHLWLLTTKETFRPGSNFFHRNLEHGALCLVALSNALFARKPDAAKRWLVFTNGALAIGNEPMLNPEKAAVIGPLETLRAESDVVASCVELSLSATTSANELGTLTDQVIQELASGEGGVIAHARGARLARRLKRLPAHDAKEPEIAPGVTLVIGDGPLATAALGAYTRHDSGARTAQLHTVSLPNSNGALRDPSIASADRLVDVTDAQQLSEAVQNVSRDLGPPRRVVLALSNPSPSHPTGSPVEVFDAAFSAAVARLQVIEEVFEPLNVRDVLVLDRASNVLPNAGTAVDAAIAEFTGAFALARASDSTRWRYLAFSELASPELQPPAGTTAVERDRAFVGGLGFTGSDTALAVERFSSSSSGLSFASTVNLPAYSARLAESAKSGEDRVHLRPASTPEELRLAAIWQDLLGLPRVSASDNFFDLGGHSLLAARLFSAIENEFGVAFPLSLLFETPALEALAARVATSRTGDSEPKTRAPNGFRYVVRLHSGNQPSATPLFVVGGAFGNILNLRHMAQLCAERDFYGIQARGLLGNDAPHESFQEAATAYLDELRRVQPKGPYLLGGFCAGGITALEMARQLKEQGEEIEQLVMFDAHLPSFARTALTKLDLVRYHAAGLKKAGPREYLTQWARSRYAWERQKLVNIVRERLGMDNNASKDPAAYRSARIFAAIDAAMDNYHPRFYDGSVVLLRPPLPAFCTVSGGRVISQARDQVGDDNGWRPWVRELRIHEIGSKPGDHDGFVLEPSVRQVVKELARYLNN